MRPGYDRIVHARVKHQEQIPTIRKSQLESLEEKSQSIESANNQGAACLSFATDGVEQCLGVPSPAHKLVLQLERITLS